MDKMTKYTIIGFSIALLILSIVFVNKSHAATTWNSYDLWRLNGDQAYNANINQFDYATSTTYYFVCKDPYHGYGYGGVGPTPNPLDHIVFNAQVAVHPYPYVWPELGSTTINSSTKLYWFTDNYGWINSSFRLYTADGYSTGACDNVFRIWNTAPTQQEIYEIAGLSGSTSTINFVYPPDVSSINTSFDRWKISYTNNSINTEYNQLIVYWGTNPNTNETNYQNIDGGFNLQPMATGTHTYYVQRGTKLKDNTTYYAKVLIPYTNTSSTITFATGNLTGTYYTAAATSSPTNWNFHQINNATGTISVGGIQIGSSTLANWFDVDCSYLWDQTSIANLGWSTVWNATKWIVNFPTEAVSFGFNAFKNLFTGNTTSTDISSQSATSTTVGVMEIASCYVKKTTFSIMGWFIIPPPWATGFVEQGLADIKHEFPFKLIFDRVEELQNVAETSSIQSETLNLNIPQIGLNMNVLSANTLENMVGSSTKNMVFTVERYIIWLMVGLGLIMIII